MNKNTMLPVAEAIVRGENEYSQLTGKIKFYQKQNAVLVIADVKGLPKTATGFFGFHIHEGKSCDGGNFEETKGHYNPTEAPHPAHVGDLPPLMLCNGGAYLAVATDRFRLADIIGRTVVIHNMPDDFNSQPAGNSGVKIGCGVIRRLALQK